MTKFYRQDSNFAKKEEKKNINFNINKRILNAIRIILFYIGALKKVSVTEDEHCYNYCYELRRWHPITLCIYIIFLIFAIPSTVVYYYKEYKIQFTYSERKK